MVTTKIFVRLISVTSLVALSSLTLLLRWRPPSPSLANNVDDAVEKRDVEQRRRIDSICKSLHWPNHNNSDPIRLNHTGFFIGDVRQYLYCVVPKVACTTWKRVLMTMSAFDMKFDAKLTGTLASLPRDRIHSHSYSDRLLQRVSRFSWPELKWRLDTYYKFMFVREPLERLLSGYLDQVVRHKTNVLDYIPKIKAKRRLTGRIDVQFPEFVQIVIDTWRKGQILDKHWRPQHELCQPCYFSYDFIGHYETLYDDADKVLTRLNSVRNMTNVTIIDWFPRSDPDNDKHRQTRAFMTAYYSRIPPDNMRQLYDLYSIDYEMFGFERPYDIH